MRLRRKNKPRRERYELSQSPLAQKLTQKKFAALIRVPLPVLKGLIKYKASFVAQKPQEEIAGKLRDLCFPVGRLRLVNEKIKFQLDKIKLPHYVLSPRKGFGQRENALAHRDAVQVLKLDLRKFYPSVTRESIAAFFREECGMHADVAGLITHLLTHDEVVFFGAPATPVLVMLSRRRMFDEIDAICRESGVTMTLWVDNLTISGNNVPGELLNRVRAVIAAHGHKSHDIVFEHTNRPVAVTGINICSGQISPANSTNLAVLELERSLRAASNFDEYETVSNALLSRLGSQLHVIGTKGDRGRKISQRMNVIRQKRTKMRKLAK